MRLKKIKRLNAAVSASRDVKRNHFSLPCTYFSLLIRMSSGIKATAHWQNTKTCQAESKASADLGFSVKTCKAEKLHHHRL